MNPTLGNRSHTNLSSRQCGRSRCGTSLDAHDIDPASIRLVGVAPLRTDFEDVGAPGTGEPCPASVPDGLPDLALKFDTEKLVKAIVSGLGREPVDREVLTLNLSGQLRDGTPITGMDVVIAMGTMD